ncbi:hypothetical protein GCK32_003762, partial [Trichostrongylus colubriformis]
NKQSITKTIGNWLESGNEVKNYRRQTWAMSAWLQVTLAVVMFLTTAIAGFIPLKLLRFLDKRQGDNKTHGRWLSLLSCFSGGVFMGTENYEDFKVLSGTDFEFPLPQFFTCVGFFLVYLIEEVCIKVFAMKHDHGSAVTVVEKPVQKDNLNLRKYVFVH